ncbi:hypothetical protein ACL6C3_13140 [Capilliphycus salinus ALCB114379]|uniref:hypothetical protein n=1 Tax=Capilliphycus salinus TaxID=2768948 RepID=UPI0039A4F1E8
MTPEFFTYHAQAILQLRRQKKLVIVDVGGMVQPEKMPVLEACTHYLIISSKPETVPAWHEFCSERGNLKPVAEIISVLDKTQTLHKPEPFLQMTCGPWIRGNTCSVPEVLLQRIQALINSAAS